MNVLVFALQGAFGMLVWILPTFFFYGRCASGGCTNLLDEDAVRIQPLDRYNFLIFYGSFLQTKKRKLILIRNQEKK